MMKSDCSRGKRSLDESFSNTFTMKKQKTILPLDTSDAFEVHQANIIQDLAYYGLYTSDLSTQEHLLIKFANLHLDDMNTHCQTNSQPPPSSYSEDIESFRCDNCNKRFNELSLLCSHKCLVQEDGHLVTPYPAPNPLTSTRNDLDTLLPNTNTLYSSRLEQPKSLASFGNIIHSSSDHSLSSRDTLETLETLFQNANGDESNWSIERTSDTTAQNSFMSTFYVDNQNTDELSEASLWDQLHDSLPSQRINNLNILLQGSIEE